MLKTKILTFRVKQKDHWVHVENVEVTYWVEYKQGGYYYFEEFYSIEVYNLKVPSWASFVKDRIESFIKNNPRKVEFNQNSVIEIT